MQRRLCIQAWQPYNCSALPYNKAKPRNIDFVPVLCCQAHHQYAVMSGCIYGAELSPQTQQILIQFYSKAPDHCMLWYSWVGLNLPPK